MTSKNIRFWSAVVATILVVIVVLQNTEAVETRLLFATVEMPRAVLLLITLAIGFVSGLVFGRRLAKGKPNGAGETHGR